ncbi:MAG TPA: hypothetical protein VMG60_14910 [Burkholderiaceae bacterium]|nr:hypothetical protein [Burkholderiaceae bacterium]
MALALAQANLLLPGMEQTMDKAVREAKRVRKRAAASPGNSSGNHIRSSPNAEHHVPVHTLVQFSVINQRRQS